jgi:hypothetical protein
VKWRDTICNWIHSLSGIPDQTGRLRPWRRGFDHHFSFLVPPAFGSSSLRILRSSVNVYGSGGRVLNCLLRFAGCTWPATTQA